MSKKLIVILSLFVTSIIFTGVCLTNKYQYFGILLGYVAGIINYRWLYRDIKRILDKNIKGALALYNISLFSRLGMVTMFLAVIYKFKPEWLLFFVIGLVVGVFLPLVLVLRQQLKYKRG